MIKDLDSRLLELSDAATTDLVAPPVDDQDYTCGRCRTYTDRLSSDCWNCVQNRQRLGSPSLRLDMISLYKKPSHLRDLLTQYKGRTDGSEPYIEEYVPVVQALIARFLHEHGARIQSREPIDVISFVPSTSRPRPHPLQAVLGELQLEVPVEALLERGTGQLDYNKPSTDAFVASKSQHSRVYLIDDVYTTGARINSAAAALRSAGFTVAGAFVIARRVNIGYKKSPEFWSTQEGKEFSWKTSPIVSGM
ncbi:amidophosphoribosyltransferase [Rhodococcus sp. SBT000017]|jgi:predicted amidophosphoribosyltransferase|nr:amidophosphoribosyltransferase [Rhodococcus sp. SBT000017]